MFAGFNSMAPDVWDYREDLQNVAAVSMGEARSLDEGPSALEEALGRLHLPRGQSAAQTWLHIVVSSMALEAAGVTRRRSVDHYLDDAVGPDNVTQDRSPAGLDAEIVLRSKILDVIAALPDRYQAALLLKDGHGLTVGQTASLLELSAAATRSVLYRARAAIRDSLSA
jgi:DNA-directed RNA polymerase specialized sigma24 family protein